MLDAILMEEQGVPAIAVVTAPFRPTGEAMAASWGMGGYPFLDMSHPIANLTDKELNDRADRLLEAVERLLQPDDRSASGAPSAPDTPSWRRQSRRSNAG